MSETGTLDARVDHVSWYIISAIANLPDRSANLERLLKNQDDTGDAVKPFYGDPAGQKLTDLLKAHIKIAGDVVGAAAKSDNPGVEGASRRWTANADEIAVFLSAKGSIAGYDAVHAQALVMADALSAAS